LTEIKSLIVQDYSPEQVAVLLKKKDETTVSHEWIYQFIWKDKHQKGTSLLI
jgi:IS30 family transposase